jgi:molecular chaperone GrpE
MSHKKDKKHHKEKEPQVEEQVDKQAQELAELKDKYLRLAAEFDNARKRYERDKIDLLKFANSNILRELTTVLDTMEQALKMAHDHKSVDKITQGMELVHKNLLKIMREHGLKEIETEGQVFDPHLHEIVASREIDQSEGPEHVILEEVQKGYMYEDKLLRTAKVIIGVHKKE